MKNPLIAAAFLILCCMTGCGAASSESTHHHTSRDETKSTVQAKLDADTPSEIDVFADAELQANAFDNAYPAALTVHVTSGDSGVGIDCTISEATPERIVIDAEAAAERAETYLTKNHYALSKASERYEIAPTEIKHYLLSATALTSSVVTELQEGMVAELNASSLSPCVMYTVLPSPDLDYVKDNNNGNENSIQRTVLDYKQYRLYVIFTDDDGKYYAAYASPVFRGDGTLIHVNEQSVEHTKYGHLENKKDGTSTFTNREDAYAAITETYQEFADTLILSEYLCY